MRVSNSEYKYLLRVSFCKPFPKYLTFDQEECLFDQEEI
jgi:hypothetical protein